MNANTSSAKNTEDLKKKKKKQRKRKAPKKVDIDDGRSDYRFKQDEPDILEPTKLKPDNKNTVDTGSNNPPPPSSSSYPAELGALGIDLELLVIKVKSLDPPEYVYEPRSTLGAAAKVNHPLGKDHWPEGFDDEEMDIDEIVGGGYCAVDKAAVVNIRPRRRRGSLFSSDDDDDEFEECCSSRDLGDRQIGELEGDGNHWKDEHGSSATNSVGDDNEAVAGGGSPIKGSVLREETISNSYADDIMKMLDSVFEDEFGFGFKGEVKNCKEEE